MDKQDAPDLAPPERCCRDAAKRSIVHTRGHKGNPIVQLCALSHTAVTNKGTTPWKTTDGNFDSDRLIEFPCALAKDAGRKVFVILDNLRVRHSKPMTV